MITARQELGSYFERQDVSYGQEVRPREQPISEGLAS